MNTQQNIAAAAGLGLIGANFWTGPQRRAFTGGALNNSAGAPAQQSAHAVVRELALELVFVGVLVLVAGGSKAAGRAVLAIIGALALVWLMRHYG